MTQDIKIGVYKHYKGQLYQVIGVAHHADTKEPFVVYQALYDSEEFGDRALWIRPASVFAEKVFVNEKEVPRFEYLGRAP